jgi:hypothetical protein
MFVRAGGILADAMRGLRLPMPPLIQIASQGIVTSTSSEYGLKPFFSCARTRNW